MPPHRSLRAIVVLLMIWAGARAAMLWPVKPSLPKIASGAQPLIDNREYAAVKLAHFPATQLRKAFSSHGRINVLADFSRPVDAVIHHAISIDHAAKDIAIAETVAQIPQLSQPPTIATSNVTAAPRARISMTSWVLIRPEESPIQLASAGQLGGSQIGARINLPIFALTHHQIVTLSARASSGLARPYGTEVAAAIGIKHHGRVSGELLVERRFKANEGGRSDFAVIAAAGLYDVRITPHLSADAYIQAGVVGLKSRDAFADLAARVEHDMTSNKWVRVSAGAGIWAGAQPGVTRLDIGPQIIVRPKVKGAGARISAEWRFRIAGNARPASGPSLSAGLDF